MKQSGLHRGGQVFANVEAADSGSRKTTLKASRLRMRLKANQSHFFARLSAASPLAGKARDLSSGVAEQSGSDQEHGHSPFQLQKLSRFG